MKNVVKSVLFFSLLVSVSLKAFATESDCEKKGPITVCDIYSDLDGSLVQSIITIHDNEI